jgi:hypothetical protein
MWIVLLLQTLKDDWRRAFHQGLKIGCYCDGLSLGIIDCQAGQVLAIGELLHSALEDGGISALKIPFDVSAQALAE